MLKGDPDAAVPWLARAIAAARAAGQLPQLSESLSLASTAAIVTGDHAEARRLLDEAATITPGLEHYPASMGLIQARAIHALFEGDLAAAEAASSEGARTSREVGDLYYLERMLMNLGLVAVAAGDLPASKAAIHRGAADREAIRQPARTVILPPSAGRPGGDVRPTTPGGTAARGRGCPRCCRGRQRCESRRAVA